MKKIETLIDDIHKLLEGEVKLSEDNIKSFSDNLHAMLVDRLGGKEHGNHLRMSNFGTPCERKLWKSVNNPEESAPLPPSAKLKFLIGDILEEVLLFLAKEAGHTVEGEQDTIVLHGVTGHRDAIIDGVQVDVKSASPFGYQKFVDHKLEDDDPFGYLDQQNLYLEGGKHDPIIKDKSRFGFLVMHKVLGHLHLDMYDKKEENYEAKVLRKKAMLEGPMPDRAYVAEPDGKSGNMKLCMECGYCDYKKTCWPNMRTFYYSNGPRHLVRVVRQPDVPEENRDAV